MALEVEFRVKEDTTAGIAAGKRAKLLAFDTTLKTLKYVETSGTTLYNVYTLDANMDSVNAVGNVLISTAKYIGIGASSERIYFDGAGNCVTVKSSDFSVDGSDSATIPLTVACTYSTFRGSTATTDFCFNLENQKPAAAGVTTGTIKIRGYFKSYATGIPLAGGEYGPIITFGKESDFYDTGDCADYDTYMAFSNLYNGSLVEAARFTSAGHLNLA